MTGSPPDRSRHGGGAVVIQTAFYGDVILSTPLIRRASERSGAPVDVVVQPAALPVLQNNPCIRNRIPFDKRGRDSGLAGFVRLVHQLRRRRYDVARPARASGSRITH